MQEYIEGKDIFFDILVDSRDFFVIQRDSLKRMGHLDRTLKVICNSKYKNILKPLIEKIRKISKTKRFILNVDARETEKGLYVLEVNPRPSVYFPFIFSSHPLLAEIFINFLRKGKIDKNLKREVRKLKPFEVHTKLTFLKRSL